MIDATNLRPKRTAAGIAGNILCKKLGIARSRLSDIERAYITPSAAELSRIDAALDELIRAKSILRTMADAVGWPSGEIK
jgi:transcriptional regulator with XRE-family HTH domain